MHFDFCVRQKTGSRILVSAASTEPAARMVRRPVFLPPRALTSSFLKNSRTGCPRNCADGLNRCLIRPISQGFPRSARGGFPNLLANLQSNGDP